MNLGTIVMFCSGDGETNAQLKTEQPALVCAVYETTPAKDATEDEVKAFVPQTLVNLAVFDSLGSVHPKTGVAFEPKEKPDGAYAFGNGPKAVKPPAPPTTPAVLPPGYIAPAPVVPAP